MIESDIRKIRSVQKKAGTSTSKKLKELSKWHFAHEKDNNQHFADITEILNKLPTEEGIKQVIAENIKLVVNGKIDKLSVEVANIGEHLKRQDETAELQGTAILDLTNKVAPWEKTRIFGIDAVKVIVYCGSVAGALAAIIGFLYLVGALRQ